MRVFEYSLVTNGSMGASITSALQNLEQMMMAGIQANWSGTSPVGTLSLQISNDNTTWTDYSGSSTSVSGNTGNFMWNLWATPYQYIRVIYTRASGTGTLNVTVNGKGV